MLNKAILMGRLTADPELKQTPSGISVATFSLAVNRNYGSKDGTRQADFINIVAWRQTAEFVSKYFAKGQQVIVEGSIQTRGYEDKQGNKRTAFEVVASQVYFAEGKRDNDSSTSTKSASLTALQNAKATQPPAQPQTQVDMFGVGSFSDFDEIEDDGDLPF